MTYSIHQVDWYLKKWGRYLRRNRTQYLGLPTISVIGRCMAEGPGAGQSTAPVEYDPPGEVELIDGALRHISECHRRVLEYYYIQQGASIRKGAKYFEVSVHDFRKKLDDAKQRIKLELNA